VSGRHIFLLLFLGLGLWSLASGTIKAAEGLAARSWPSAEGRVIQSRIEEFYSHQRLRFRRLCFRIDYLYLLGGTVYEGHRVNAGWSCFGSEDLMQGLLARYPVGAKVRVFYDPERPDRALLEPGLDWTVYFQWGLGVMGVSAGLPLFRLKKAA